MLSSQASQLIDKPVVEQKIDLRQQLELLRQLLAEQSETEEGMSTQWEVFGEALKLRFTWEEEGDHFEEAIFKAPWLTAEVEVLKQQHVKLLDAVDLLTCRIAAPDHSPILWDEFRRELDLFAEQFLEHEAYEFNLQQEAYVSEGRLE